MREILFRGKRLDNGEWVEGHYADEPYTKNTYNRGYILENEKDLFAKPVDLRTVGQYTGLTDKNGKKIFEGDIVKTKFGRICKVIFFQSPCYCGIDLIPLEDKHKCPDEFDLYLSDNLEIIGNIHDNPELLKERENNAN